MSDKYIIKNCPAYSKDALDFCFAKNATQAICYNCTNCVMKQVVEECRGHHTDLHFTPSEILALIDIQEVE